MTKIKICGIKTLESGLAALEAGADYLGFMFYGPSPRFIVPEAAGVLLADLRLRRPSGWQAVGVFVNETAEKISRIADDLTLDVVQCSGDETPEDIRRIARPVFKAVRFGADDTGSAAAFGAERLLVDANVAGSYGGTGVSYDWRTVRAIVAKGILAGGLTPENVGNAISVARPWGVDVSSGVESTTGHKSPDLIRSFIAAVRAADSIMEEATV